MKQSKTWNNPMKWRQPKKYWMKDIYIERESGWKNWHSAADNVSKIVRWTEIVWMNIKALVIMAKWKQDWKQMQNAVKIIMKPYKFFFKSNSRKYYTITVGFHMCKSTYFIFLFVCF